MIMKIFKEIAILILITVVLALGLSFYGFHLFKNISKNIIGAQYEKNATYLIEGRKITLINGISEVPAAPGSASKIITRYFGNEVRHDFNGDGREDVAFLLTQTMGGSGTFYYVVAALNTSSGYVGSEAVLLGDRIAPQSTEMGNGNTVIVNYVDRKSGESFIVAPSVGKSIWLVLDPNTMKLNEVL